MPPSHATRNAGHVVGLFTATGMSSGSMTIGYTFGPYSGGMSQLPQAPASSPPLPALASRQRLHRCPSFLSNGVFLAGVPATNFFLSCLPTSPHLQAAPWATTHSHEAPTPTATQVPAWWPLPRSPPHRHRLSPHPRLRPLSPHPPRQLAGPPPPRPPPHPPPLLWPSSLARPPPSWTHPRRPPSPQRKGQISQASQAPCPLPA